MDNNGINTFRHYEDLEAFDKLYRECLSDARNNKEAYRKVEEQFKSRFGKRRYSSYESFKVNYSKRHSRKVTLDN